MRSQLPVYSPLPASALLAPLAGDDHRARLAEELRGIYGAREVLLTDSGTGALTLALKSVSSSRPGLPILLPAYACFDLVTAAVGAAAPIVFYDIDPSTLAPEPTSLRRALAAGAAAMVLVHLHGLPVAFDGLVDEARRSGVVIIEDAAQGTGAYLDGGPLGAHGDVGILSFGRGKGETGGGGGALILRNAEGLSAPLRSLIRPPSAGLSFGIKLAAQWALGRPALYAIPSAIPALQLGQTVYREPYPIHEMSPASSRVLAATRRLAATEADTRRRNAARLLSAFRPSGRGHAVTTLAGSKAGYLRLPIVMDSGAALPSPLLRLGLRRGYPTPLPMLPAIQPLLTAEVTCPGANRLARSLLTLPTHSLLTEADLLALESWLGSPDL